LRRAIIMAYDTDKEVRVIRKNQALADNMPIPDGVIGHDPTYRGILKYDPVLANRLLDYFGYKKGADGYRNDPSGKPFAVVLTSEPPAIYREYDELWLKALDAVGLRFETRKSPFSDNIKAGEACQLAMWGWAWAADYPDGADFMQLFYGPNTHQSNHGCYESPAYDAMYRQIVGMPDSPERNRIMLKMARQLEVDGAIKLGVSRYRNVLVYPQVKGYRYHPMLTAAWEYLDIDPTARKQ
jgi:ABC-type transport system substrate-binding protein